MPRKASGRTVRSRQRSRDGGLSGPSKGHIPMPAFLEDVHSAEEDGCN
jgi:hypothetical protein